MLRSTLFTCLLISSAAHAANTCGIDDKTVSKLKAAFTDVTQKKDNGGIFKPNLMWGAIVDRDGKVCAIMKSGDAWPGSRAIAVAKANAANAFSNNKLAISTANLYSAVQPGGSLFGLNMSNVLDPSIYNTSDTQAVGKAFGGVITFGGGVALYNAKKEVIGGFGVSGDTACADHTVAYRVRKAAELDAIPGGVGPANTDNIDYLQANEAPNGFKHPMCGASNQS